MRIIRVGGLTVRAAIRTGRRDRPPLLVFNGIGANFELTLPLLRALPDVEVVLFDVPGTGGSPLPPLPYRFCGLARLADRMMRKLGHAGPIDVLGVSWGGAPAQQFACQYRGRCRRLVLAATSPGALMVPGRPSALLAMLGPRRYRDPQYLRRVGPRIYGGVHRKSGAALESHAEAMEPPHRLGYVYQLLAGVGWSSLPWLWTLRQPTLVMHGRDDPLVPLANARILAALIPDARLAVFENGHLFTVTRADEVASAMSEFLAAEAA